MAAYGPDAPGKKINLGETWWNQGDGSSKGKIWLEQWPDWKKATQGGGLTDPTYAAVALGPFVVKNQRSECQIIVTYRSRWMWGGEVLSRSNAICDPKTNTPKSQPMGTMEFNEAIRHLRREYIGTDVVHKPEDWGMLDQSCGERTSVRHGAGRQQESSHPVSVPVDKDEISENFDKISYSKGASIIRILCYFLTEKIFRKGVANYRKRGRT
nr:ORF1b [Torque teno neovison virus]